MRTFNLKPLLCILILTISTPLLAQINLLRNASFEQTIPDSAGGGLSVCNVINTGCVILPGWTVTGPNFSSSFPYPTGADLIVSPSGAFDGDKFLELRRTEFGNSLLQTVNVTPGTTYYVCARVGNLTGAPIIEQAEILINGVRVTSGGVLSTSVTNWYEMPIRSFVATSSSVTFEIKSIAGSVSDTSPKFDLAYLGTDPVCPTSFNDADGDGEDDALSICAINDPGSVTGSCVSPSNDLEFSLNLSGNATGTTYMVTGATPATGTYGTSTMFTIASGADSTDKMITITDDTDTACALDITITGAAACFSCPAGTEAPRFLGLTKSTWMTIGLTAAVGAGAFVLLKKFVF